MAFENALALMVQPYDASKPYMAAAQLRGLEQQNALQGLNIQQQQLRTNSLQRFAANPNDPSALAGAPDMMATIVQTYNAQAGEKRAQYADAVIRNAKDAQEVASVPEGPDRTALWQSKIDAAAKEGRLDPQRASILRAQPPNSLVLQQAMRAGLTIQQQIELEQKERQEATGNRVLGAVTGVLGGGGVPAGNEGRVIQRESGGNPSVVNDLGYAGTYQYGAPRVTDLGVYKPGTGENVSDKKATGQWSGQKWTGEFNIPGFPQVKTIRDFLQNPEAQKAVRQLDLARADSDIQAMGLDQYVGKTVGGVPITMDGLRNMIHLGGAAGTQRFMASDGKVNPADKNGTKLSDYASMGAQGGAAPATGAPSSAPMVTGRGVGTGMTPEMDQLVTQLPALQAMRLIPNLPVNVAKGLDGLVDYAEKLAIKNTELAQPPTGYRWNADRTELKEIKGGPADQPNDVQRSSALYAARMEQANPLIAKFEQAGLSTKNRALFEATIPFTDQRVVPQILANKNVPKEFQQLVQAERNFLNAVLRRESGAVISASEFAEGAAQYFPRPGDSAEVLAQKAENRRVAIQGIKQAGDKAAYSPVPAATAAPAATAPAAPAIPPPPPGFELVK
jgi:hypothetical protein